MFLTLRVDLDYVPWDTPDAEDFGHGEVASLLKLLDFARNRDISLHFFASNRVLRAFPTEAEAILSDGHELDWLCKHPEDFAGRYQESIELFDSLDHPSIGWGLKGAWPEDRMDVVLPPAVRFVSSSSSSIPPGPKLFLVEAKGLREAIRADLGISAWADNLKGVLRSNAAVGKPCTILVRPQVLAKVDPKLTRLSELIELASAIGLTVATYREQL